MKKIRIAENKLNFIVSEAVKMMMNEGLLDDFSDIENDFDNEDNFNGIEDDIDNDVDIEDESEIWRGVDGAEVIDGSAIRYNDETYELSEVEDFIYPYYEKLCSKKGIEPTDEDYNSMEPSWFKKGLETYIEKEKA